MVEGDEGEGGEGAEAAVGAEVNTIRLALNPSTPAVHTLRSADRFAKAKYLSTLENGAFSLFQI